MHDDDLDVIGGAVSEEHQHLTFVVNKETFAIAVLDIKEIIEFAMITRVPQMQSFIAGVINVRGKVIPVIDLADRFMLGTSDTSNCTCIIVETSDQGEVFEIGLIVDAVDQVYAILPETIEETPSFGTRVRKDFIAHMAKMGDGFVSVLDLSTLLSVDELCVNDFSYKARKELIVKKEKSTLEETMMKLTSSNVNQEENATHTENESDEDDLIGLITSNADASGQYVIFRNGFDKLYAINVAKVEELIAYNEIELTENSNTFSTISGVSKIRENVIPIIKFDRWLGNEADESVYELVMVCHYGSERLGLVIKNVLGILSIDSNKMIDNSDKDEKTSFITEVTLGGVHGLCLIFDSDKLLMEVFPKIERNEIAKTNGLKMGRTINGKLLSAEDSSVIRSALTTVYEQLGIDYEIFKDGSLLFERIKTMEPSDVSIIVTDLEMPVMDGLKLIEALKAEPAYASVPIIVNTNMANESVSTKCTKFGVNHIIAKLDVEELTKSIRTYAR